MHLDDFDIGFGANCALLAMVTIDRRDASQARAAFTRIGAG